MTSCGWEAELLRATTFSVKRLERLNGVVDSHFKLNERLKQLSEENDKLRIENEKLAQRAVTPGETSKLQDLQAHVDLLRAQSKLRESEDKIKALDSELAASKAEIEKFSEEKNALKNKLELVQGDLLVRNMQYRECLKRLKDRETELMSAVAEVMKWKNKYADGLDSERENFEAKQRADTFGSLDISKTISGDGSPNPSLRGSSMGEVIDSALTLGRSKHSGSVSEVTVGHNVVIKPTGTAKMKFKAHDNEINAVVWGNMASWFATAGVDRRVKLWKWPSAVSMGQPELKLTLVGVNQAIVGLDVDASDQQIVCASSDNTARVWSTVTGQMVRSLTGHLKKVSAARFFPTHGGGQANVLTASEDHTLKIWEGYACHLTIHAASRCWDVAPLPESGEVFASGHHNGEVLIWDARVKVGGVEQRPMSQLTLAKSATSLSVLRAGVGVGPYLLASCLDDTLKLIDFRMVKVLKTLSAENFRIPRFTKATLSPDGAFAACGSNDGSVFVWETAGRGRLVCVLGGEHGGSIIHAVGWAGYPGGLVSVDKAHNCVIWD